MKQVFMNGTVYTGNGLCEAFAVEDGNFIATGTTEEMKSQFPNAQFLDLQGKFVCAGFNDSHMHLLNDGYGLSNLPLAEHTGSLSELLSFMKQEIVNRHIAPGTWIRGRGWNHDFFHDGHRFPTRYDLDTVSVDHPIAITRACGHACVVNSKALEFIGVTKDTPQVEGGRFDTDENGEPNGIFRENALDMVYSKFPMPTRQELKEMMINAMHHLNSYGVTSCQTDDFVVFHGLDYHEVIAAYQELEKEGKMTVRVYEQNHFTNIDDLKGFIEEGYNTGVGTDIFRFGPLKMLGDGSLGARTAYLSEPYSDDSSTCGIPVYSQETFDEMLGYANEHGMQVAIHSIGDGILDRILNAIEKALKSHPRCDHRHGIIHCQITRPDQLDRMAKLHLHCYAQTIFLDYDIKIVEERVGKKRASSSYNFKTLMNKGVCVSNGSDCPVEQPDVLGGMQCAVTRSTLKEHIGPYLPEEAFTPKEALDSFTINSAHASFDEAKKGKIQEGMLADFVILDDNPLTVDPFHIHDIHVLETWMNGNCVFTR